MSDKYKRYHKIAKIGSGGMGDVFRVLDMDLGRECALKCVPLQVASESGVEGIKPSGRLLREVSIMTGIQDPNVVYIYDHFQHESQLCIVMELCQISVADWVQQRESFSLLTTLEMANQILSALIVIHDNGIIHRDIKPHNILISTNGKQFKLTDFGLAALRDASMVLTQSGVFAGTVAFMPPEQRLSFKGVTPQGDMYSLAMTMQWVLFGELKGDLFSPRTQQLLVTEGEQRSWPTDVAKFFQRAGMEDPAERFSSAEEMQREVQQILQQLDGSTYTRLTASDVQSVHRFESKLSSSSKPVQFHSGSLSTEELQAETNRWLKGLLLVLVVLFLVVLTLGYQIFSIAPSGSIEGSAPVRETTSDIPLCEDRVVAQHQYRKLGPRETQRSDFVDVDGDGFQDIVYANQLDASLSVYWGSEEAGFDPPTEYSVGRINRAPLVGDVNHDGLVDMVTFHGDESMIRTHIQGEDRQFTQVAEDFQGPPPVDGTLVDINEDGWLDLVFTVPGLEQNIQYRLGSEEGFLGHISLARVPNLTFIPNTTQILYVEDDVVWKRTLQSNLSLSVPEQISTLSNIRRILPMLNRENIWVLYAQRNNGQLIRLIEDPCVAMELTSIETSKMMGLGDWNRDGYLDWAGFITCAECTSNHLLYLGAPSSVD